MLRNGQTATVNGRPLTLRDPELWQMVGAVEPKAAVRKLFGNDNHVETTAGEVLLRSGLDDEIEEADPQTAS